jgi:hypothetical protein
MLPIINSRITHQEGTMRKVYEWVEVIFKPDTEITGFPG